MKTPIFFFLMALSLTTAAQNVSGFYTGTLFNDSTKMLQKFELALSDYRGKIDGYSYVTFVKNDTFYYGIRKVKARIVGDSLIVQDDKMVSNNFPEPPAKGVGRTITIPLRGQDSLKVINGSWKTNQTKKYYSVPGVINMNLSFDSTKSPLIAHLRELNLIETPVYYQNMVSQPLAVAEPKKDKKGDKNTAAAAKTTGITADTETTASSDKKNKDTNTGVTTSSQPTDKGTSTTATTTAAAKPKGGKDADSKTVGTPKDDQQGGTPSAATQPKTTEGTTTTASVNNKQTGTNDPVAGAHKAKQPGMDETTAANTSRKMDPNGTNSRKDEVKKEAETLTAAKKETKPEVVAAPTVLPYAQRQNKLIQTIEVSSDSVILAFYDNGVVDGDSVSVYLNEETVVTNMRLTTVANKKIITIREGRDEQLLLVAENLGRLPPNTGLITIRDGENYFQVNFSADMLNNASIILRRKKK